MSYQSKKAQSAISAQSMSYLETLYEQYLSNNKQEMNHEFLDYFHNLQSDGLQKEHSHQAIIASIKYRKPAHHATGINGNHDIRFLCSVSHQMRDWFIENGHFHAKLGMQPYPRIHANKPCFEWAKFGVRVEDLSIPFTNPQSSDEPRETTLSALKTKYERQFQSSIGFEFHHIKSEEQRDWLLKQLSENVSFSAQDKKNNYQLLAQSEQLEHYLARSYIGQKRFSIEGAESFILALDKILHESSKGGVEEVVLGMAHRGRLNTMVNTLGLPCGDIDSWFRGFKMSSELISGDVKYHLGYSSDRKFDKQIVHITLNFNPSHLESIVPVTMGAVRARQNDYKLSGYDKVLPILVHGDASFTGQGVVAESLNMSYTEAYAIGGSLHVIINNQIGFTTTPDQSRSTYYCTDFAKAIDAPIIHVNGDDPEATVFAARLAARYRAKFKKDIVLDILCYRRHGHNEADEPGATNPLIYKKVKASPSVVKRYEKQLIQEAIVSKEDIDSILKSIKAKIKRGERLIEVCHGIISKREDYWKDHIADDWREAVDTSISTSKIQALGQVVCHIPDNFTVQKQVAMMIDARNEMYSGVKDLNWGAAEALAFASLLDESISVRLVGQDCCRGTFAHRHATIYDQNNGDAFTPCRTLSRSDCLFELYNSTLSEFSAVGYEYGYAMSHPKSLVIWEAQFGDFANGAQVIIDQYISSAWQKWGRMCGMVMLLPHGYEGQGPEHSSARLERYLQLCAEQNIQVCVPSTPSQYFHLLRRQALRKFRAPLIIISPKSLLRNPQAVSKIKEIHEGSFKLIIDDDRVHQKSKITRLILCSGKVYYDCLDAITKDGLQHIALCRIEQLYPFPDQELKKILGSYKNVKTVIWCQEEPNNQGAWYVMRTRMTKCLLPNQSLAYAGRPKMASSAPGDHKQYAEQQAMLVNQALNNEYPD